MKREGRHKVQREVVHTLVIFFVYITQTSLIPVDDRAIATFLEGEGVFIVFMVLFHVSQLGNIMHHG